MNTTRRTFLRGLFTVTALAVTGLPALASDIPTIYGDGIRDDWAGLQAFVDGKPFRIEGEVIRASGGVMTGGHMRISKALAFRGPNTTRIRGVKIEALPGFVGIGVVELYPNVGSHQIDGCTLIGNGSCAGIYLAKGAKFSQDLDNPIYVEFRPPYKLGMAA